MDSSFRMEPMPDMYPADLDSTWLGGEDGYNNISNNNNNNSNKKKKVKPSPLNTDRLKVFRQVTRVAILSILETGHVSIELLRKKGDQEGLAELVVISGDGQEICVEQWRTENPYMGANFTSYAGDAVEKTWKTFSYSSLPEKYWKRYAHACRFVDLVKSKTAKVTMYSDRAKGVLMENWPPNFEATFFHGPKILMCGSDVHIKEESGASLVFHRDCLNTLVNDYTLGLIQHATQMREQCVRLEASVMTVQAMSQNSEPLFPVTVGMRPSSSFCSSSSSSNSGSIDLLSSPRFGHPHSSPSSGSQGHSTSPPSSPGPHLDLRCLDSSIRHTPTSQPFPMDAKTPQSPLRHISTLEGRKFRCQRSDSTDSSYLQFANSPTPAQPNPDPCRALPYDLQHAQLNLTSHDVANSFSEMAQNHPKLTPGLSENVGRQAQQLFIVPPETSASSSPQRTPVCSSTHPSQAACGNKALSTPPHQEAQGRQPLTKEHTSTRETSVNTGDTQSESTSELQKNMSAGSSGEWGDDTSAVVRQTFVPYTGWASQLANGTIWIHYNEGTQLGVLHDQPEVVYEDQRGNRFRYLQSDNIPEVVRLKLEKLPVVIDSLKRKPSTFLNTLASS